MELAHVFLTGERQIGKSRAVRAVIGRVTGPVRGFMTRFSTPERGRSSLYMVPAEDMGPMDEDHMVARLEEGRMRALPGRFDALGTALLRQGLKTPGALIVMDECGHLEKNALLFQQAIRDCLDGPNPVLGVLRKDQPWHDFIKSHPRVRVLEVTESSRAGIAEEALRLLAQAEDPIGGEQP